MPESHHPLQRFLACRTCLRAERLGPDLRFADDPEEPFVQRHAGHHLEPVAQVGDAFLADRPAWDPMVTTYFEVTNGSEVFLVRSGRPSIEDPVERVLLPGRLKLDHVTVEFESDLICRALDAHFFPQALRPSKIEQFGAMLAGLCREVDPNKLDIVFDAADEPHVQFGRLPDALYREIIARSAGIFDDWERERLRPFLAAARTDDGLFTLRVTRAFILEAA